MLSPLVFVSDPVKQLDLIRFGAWFSQNRGVVTASKLIVGDLLQEELDLPAEHRALWKLFAKERLPVFPDVTVVRDVVEGITGVAQANGMAALESNTVLLGWPKEKAWLVEFLRIMRRLQRVERSLLIGRIGASWAQSRAAAKHG